MKTKKNFIARFWRDVRGISSVEYALLLAFIAVGVVSAAGALSLAVKNKMENTASCIAGSGTCT